MKKTIFLNQEQLSLEGDNGDLYGVYKYEYNSTNQSNPFIYVPEELDKQKLFNLVAITGDTEQNDVLFEEEIYAQFPLFFSSVDKIIIPKKTEYAIKKYLPKNLLKEIDSNQEIAVERCLLFLSYLSSTYYSEEKWKHLYSKILEDEVGANYMHIIQALKIGTKEKGGIIEVDNFYCEGRSRKYKLTETYLKAGLVEYSLKDKEIIQKRNRSFFKHLITANKNSICRNLIELYPRITLPSEQEIIDEAKRLINVGYLTKNRNQLTFLNKHTKEYWKDYKERSFVEENIELFNFLTARGYMIPTPGDEKSGGRVVDSFTLMPSWIRNLIKIDGEKIVEADYKALHPNLAVKIYGGNEEFITHQKVAEWLKIDINTAKIEHLSFFNKRWEDMKKSPLFEYYMTNEKNMMEAIQLDKEKNGHKITSKRFFNYEVVIITKSIEIANYNGINVGYVYDALFCKEKDLYVIECIMNDTAANFGVKTATKIIAEKSDKNAL